MEKMREGDSKRKRVRGKLMEGGGETNILGGREIWSERN